MEEKLKLITKRIHWSLLLKAGVFAVLWLLGKASWTLGFAAPFWLCILSAAYFYFVPPFRSKALIWPFLFMVVFALILPPGLTFALLLAALMYLMIGIKDFVFVDRETAYEALIYVFFLLFSLTAYTRITSWGGWTVLLLPFWIGAGYFLFAKSLPWRDPPKEKTAHLTTLLCGYLAAEVALILLFLPLDLFYQTAILFLALILLSFLDVQAKTQGLSAKKVLSAFLPFTVGATIILFLNSWKI